MCVSVDSTHVSVLVVASTAQCSHRMHLRQRLRSQHTLMDVCNGICGLHACNILLTNAETQKAVPSCSAIVEVERVTKRLILVLSVVCLIVSLLLSSKMLILH